MTDIAVVGSEGPGRLLRSAPGVGARPATSRMPWRGPAGRPGQGVVDEGARWLR